MKKTVLTIAIILGMTFGASAQVFIMDANGNQRDGSEISNFNIINPNNFGNGNDYYEYAPLGSGALLLASLAGAYLIGKKHKK